MAILEFHQVSLFVGDLEKALRFYRDALGCLELARLEFGPEAALPFGLAPRAIRTVVLARAGMQLELVAWALAREGDCPGPSAPGLFHLTFTVDDLASTIHSLRDRGVEVAQASIVEHARGVASCVLRDPDGVFVRLLQYPTGVADPRSRLDPSQDGFGGAP